MRGQQLDTESHRHNSQFAGLRMHWPQQLPTVPGYYWRRRKSSVWIEQVYLHENELDYDEVWEAPGGSATFVSRPQRSRVEADDTEWAGPIPVPSESSQR